MVTHCGWGLILWCKEHHLDLVLRPPNTTSISQPEDVILFKQFKKYWYEFKDARLQARVDKAFRDWEQRGTRVEGIHLSWADFFEGVNYAYESSFTERNFKSAWSAVGVRPFTRCVEKNLRAKEQAAISRRKKKDAVKMVTLQRAMALMNDSMATSENLDDGSVGRSMKGRVCFDKPLTHEQAVAERRVVEDAKQKKRDDATAKKAQLQAAFDQRGKEAEAILASVNRDPTRVPVKKLRDFLRYKGCMPKEYNGKKEELYALFNSRFRIMGDEVCHEDNSSEGTEGRSAGEHGCDSSLDFGGSNTDSGEEGGDFDTNIRTQSFIVDSDGDGGDTPQPRQPALGLKRDRTLTLDGEWEIEEIRGGPRGDGKYLCKWEGYGSDDNTWEPRSNLPVWMVNEYTMQRLDNESSDSE